MFFRIINSIFFLYFLVFVIAENVNDENFELFGELIGNFTVKIDENEPVISELRNGLKVLYEDQNRTLIQLSEQKSEIERQNQLIVVQGSVIQDQAKLLDDYSVLLQDQQKYIEELKVQVHTLEISVDKAKQKGQWVSVCNKVPQGAIQGGHEDNGDMHYVGRALHNEVWIAAKVLAKGEAYVAYGGKEYLKGCYDVLVGGKYQWMTSSYGAIVQNAVTTQDGFYVGRAQRQKTLIVGKVIRGKGIYVPYKKKEYKYDTYEVLVEDILID